MEATEKYLSFVVTSRNDGKGDEELQRMQLFVDSLLEQCSRFKLDAELVLVEWNPPSDRPHLAQVLRWPALSSGQCSVRIIQVPPEIHRQCENAETIALFQMIAKNVGIRRAHGVFALATNIDILFSNELMRFFASRQLRTDWMYRIDRHDVPFPIPEQLTLDERFEWFDRNLLRLYRYLETVPVENGVIPPVRPIQSTFRQNVRNWLLRLEPPLHTNACGDFTLMSSEYWNAAAGYPEFPMRAMKLDGLLCYAAHYAGAKECILKEPMRIYHLEHLARADGALAALSERQSANQRLQVSPAQYTTWVEKMRRSHRPLIFNDNRWGLADLTLPEIRLV